MKKIQIMLLALLVFGAMFGTMFVLGYDSARSDAAKDPHYTEKVAFTKVKVARDNDKYLYHFVYKRGEKVLYMYDVDTNELISGDRLLEAWRTKLTTTDRDWLIVLDPSLSAAIGGVTFGIGVKDLILDPILLKQIWMLRQNNQWHVLAAVIGAIGGYGAGYAFAVHRSVPTEQILRLLSDPQRWHDNEGILFANEVEYLE